MNLALGFVRRLSWLAQGALSLAIEVITIPFEPLL